jgi:hypothetical protein
MRERKNSGATRPPTSDCQRARRDPLGVKEKAKAPAPAKPAAVSGTSELEL